MMFGKSIIYCRVGYVYVAMRTIAIRIAMQDVNASRQPKEIHLVSASSTDMV
jgi:hypothetical protein